MVFDDVAIETDDIATHSHLIPFDGHLHRGRFERTTTFEDFRDVVAQESQVSNFRTRMITLWDGDEPSIYTFASQSIDIGFASRLQWRLAAKQFDGLVSSSVS